MRVFGKLLMVFGALVGLAVAAAMLAHVGVAGPWLVNVALAKLGLVASGALMAGGAVSVRLGNRLERTRLPPANDDKVGPPPTRSTSRNSSLDV
jgi:hypothetical protein